jgi:hypothetical protein
MRALHGVPPEVFKNGKKGEENGKKGEENGKKGEIE